MVVTGLVVEIDLPRKLGIAHLLDLGLELPITVGYLFAALSG